MQSETEQCDCTQNKPPLIDTQHISAVCKQVDERKKGKTWQERSSRASRASLSRTTEDVEKTDGR